MSSASIVTRPCRRFASAGGVLAACLGWVVTAAVGSGFTIDHAEGQVQVTTGSQTQAAEKGSTLSANQTLSTGADGKAALSLAAPSGDGNAKRLVVLVGPNSRVHCVADFDESVPVLHVKDGAIRFVQPTETPRTAAGLLVGPLERADGTPVDPIMIRGGDLIARWMASDSVGTMAVQRGEVEAFVGSRRIVFRPMMIRDMRSTGPSGARAMGSADWAMMADPLAISGIALPGVASVVAGAAATPDAGDSDAAAPAGEYLYFRMETTKGSFVLELDGKRAPISTENFAHYADTDFYDGTIFHRVVRTGIQVIQGGGFTRGMELRRPGRQPIANEWQNGLKNERGTISMARLPSPDSATSQFFINTSHNVALDRPDARGAAYAVFGRVVSGMEVVDAIQAVPTMTRGRHGDVPAEDVVITRVARLTDEEIAGLTIIRPAD